MSCKYNLAWRGDCGAPSNPNGFCNEHMIQCEGQTLDFKEFSYKRCRRLATHECAWAGQFVCGRPLCDACRCWH